MGIQRKRHSTDLNVNTYGRKLIQFCKNNNMYIMNGRIGNDEVGKPTSKNTSVVDYAISTAAVLYLVDKTICQKNVNLIYLTKWFYQYCYMDQKYGVLKI